MSRVSYYLPNRILEVDHLESVHRVYEPAGPSSRRVSLLIHLGTFLRHLLPFCELSSILDPILHLEYSKTVIMDNFNHTRRFAGDFEKILETDRELENQLSGHDVKYPAATQHL